MIIKNIFVKFRIKDSLKKSSSILSEETKTIFKIPTPTISPLTVGREKMQ